MSTTLDALRAKLAEAASTVAEATADVATATLTSPDFSAAAADAVLRKNPVKLARLFFSSLLSSKYLFTNGKEANFVNGQFTTAIPTEIHQLETEVLAGHPHLYMDPNRLEVDVANQDPLMDLKARIISEYEAAKQAMVKADAGTYGTQPILGGIGNSDSIAAAAAASLSR